MKSLFSGRVNISFNIFLAANSNWTGVVLESLYVKRGLPIEIVGLEGSSRLERIFSALLLADWVGLYTAQLYGTDPEQVPMVEEFKKWAKKEGLVDTHPLIPRLGGQSRFCQFKFDADGQVQNHDKDHNQDRPGHRYTVIN